MRIFISAGEPSGDLHGASLIRTLGRLRPDAEFVGFGGERMAAAGCRLLYPLCRLSVMWFLRVLANLHVFLWVLSLADRYFRHHRPDAVILIDYPGLHWWIARRAHFHGIPVFYFVPPQLWAWAPWRVKKMRRYVDHVLCTLPFEETWYRERGVDAMYVGHPYFDAVRQQRPDAAFLAQQRQRGGRIVGLLPGSRAQEVAKNFPTLRRTAARLVQELPDVRFLVACFKKEHQERIDKDLQGRGLPIETHVGRTPEIIQLSEACVAVSGSVSLELLYYAKPAVIIYRVGRVAAALAKRLATVQFITLVNLLAGKVLYPEHPSTRCEAAAVSRHIHEWLTNPPARQQLVDELEQLRTEVGQPGACDRSARYVLDALAAARATRLAA
jgi:lipid-A-disaccharide synthase